MAAPKQINTNQVVNHLTRVFERVTSGMPRASRSYNKDTGTWDTNELYDLQVDFCYFIDRIQRDPAYFVPKVISDCNAFLDRIMNEN